MTFEESCEIVRQFRRDRDWDQFHTPKDLAISISLEAAELLEHFQWTRGDVEGDGKRDEMLEELADIMVYCIHLADRLGADIPDVIAAKMAKNAEKYPVEKSRGSAAKYDEL